MRELNEQQEDNQLSNKSKTFVAAVIMVALVVCMVLATQGTSKVDGKMAVHSRHQMSMNCSALHCGQSGECNSMPMCQCSASGGCEERPKPHNPCANATCTHGSCNQNGCLCAMNGKCMPMDGGGMMGGGHGYGRGNGHSHDDHNHGHDSHGRGNGYGWGNDHSHDDHGHGNNGRGHGNGHGHWDADE